MKISIWFLHDNHTFSKLKPGSISDVIQQAKDLLKKSPYGCLCAVRLNDDNGKDIRCVGKMVNSRGSELEDTSEWEAAIRADADALRLIECKEEKKKTKFISSRDYKDDKKVIEGQTISYMRSFNSDSEVAFILANNTYFVLQHFRHHCFSDDSVAMSESEPGREHQLEIGVITKEEYESQLSKVMLEKLLEQRKKDFATYLELKERFEGEEP